jgi:hypothetical protein
MSYQAKGAGAGAAFGLIGALVESAARSSSPSDEAAAIARAIGPDHALVKAIVKSEFVAAASQRSGIQWVDGPGAAPVPRLDLTIHVYGFARSHLLASQVQPMLNLTATLTGVDGKVLWRKSDYVTALSSANAQAYDSEQLAQQPALLRAAIRQATSLVVRNIVDDLPQGGGSGVTAAQGDAPAQAASSAATPTVAPTLAPTPAPAATPTPAPITGAQANAPLGATLTFELTDTFTKNTRLVSVPRDGDVESRTLLGDLGAMRPPSGWLPSPPVQAGSTWHATFDATFGGDRVRTSLDGVVTGQERVQTRAGGFDAWRVQVRGVTMRPFSASGSTRSPHEVSFTVWVDGLSGQVVRSQGRVSGPMGSAETAELVGAAR